MQKAIDKRRIPGKKFPVKGILSLFFIAGLLTPSFSQESSPRWLLGAGLTYCSYVDNPGLNLNVTYRLVGNFHVGPDFSALLTKEVLEGGRFVKKKETEY